MPAILDFGFWIEAKMFHFSSFFYLKFILFMANFIKVRLHMEFKNFLVAVIFAVSVWALFISSMISIEDLGTLRDAGELPDQPATNFAAPPVGDKVTSMVHVLNLALPAGFAALAIILLTYRINPVDLGALVSAVCIFVFAASKAMDAFHLVESSADRSIAARVWWL